jgi:hypothetical protein
MPELVALIRAYNRNRQVVAGDVFVHPDTNVQATDNGVTIFSVLYLKVYCIIKSQPGVVPPPRGPGPTPN